jgi:hypothetical protein
MGFLPSLSIYLHNIALSIVSLGNKEEGDT